MANITVNKQDAWRANKKRSLAKKFQKTQAFGYQTAAFNEWWEARSLKLLI